MPFGVVSFYETLVQRPDSFELFNAPLRGKSLPLVLKARTNFRISALLLHFSDYLWLYPE